MTLIVNADELEMTIARLKQELKVLARRSPTNGGQTVIDQRDEINRQLAVAQNELSNVRANARYLFVLSLAALAVIAVVWTMLDFPSPIDWVAAQVDAHNAMLYRTVTAGVNDAGHNLRGMSGLPLRDPLGH